MTKILRRCDFGHWKRIKTRYQPAISPDSSMRCRAESGPCGEAAPSPRKFLHGTDKRGMNREYKSVSSPIPTCIRLIAPTLL